MLEKHESEPEWASPGNHTGNPGYVVSKLDRISRHFDHVIDINVIMSVDKPNQKAEANVHLSGKDIHVEAIEEDMYAAIDSLIDKLDRQGSEAQGPNSKVAAMTARQASASVRRSCLIAAPGRV